MKTLLVLLFPLYCFTQDTVFVSSKKDSRFLSYRDSLTTYQNYFKRVKYVTNLVKECKNKCEFNRAFILGREKYPINESITSEKKKVLVYSKIIDNDTFTCYDNCVIYYPKQVVIYKEPEYLKVKIEYYFSSGILESSKTVTDSSRLKPISRK